MKLYAGHDVHLYAWRQGPGRYKSRRGSFPCWGIMGRVRDPRGTSCWRHARVRVMVKGASSDGRGLVHVEVDSWRTLGGTGERGRVGGKAFVRLRAGH